MPSTKQSGVTDPEHERFPEVAAQIGEDPARFLDRPILGDGVGDSTPLGLAMARIRGIDRLPVVARWLEVENQLERGPREQVVEALEARGRTLKEEGERELPGRSREQLRELAAETATESVASHPDREGGERGVSAADRVGRSRLDVAADGGEADGA